MGAFLRPSMSPMCYFNHYLAAIPINPIVVTQSVCVHTQKRS